MTGTTLTQQDREALDKIRAAINENDGSGSTARWRAPIGTVPTDSNEFHHLMENGLIFLDRGIGVTIRSRYMLLDEVVATLSTEFGHDVTISNYESGGGIAFAIWIYRENDRIVYTVVGLQETREDCDVNRNVLSNIREFDTLADIAADADWESYALDWDADNGPTVWQNTDVPPFDEIVIRRDEIGAGFIVGSPESLEG